MGARTGQTRKTVQYAGMLGTVTLILGMGWFFAFRMRGTLIDSAIDAYQQTQMEIVRTTARSIEYFVADRLRDPEGGDDPRPIEQELFRRFVAPIRLLENGDAWVYAPDHVLYDESGDFPDLYRGKSMGQIFDIQKHQGARHYEEMADAVMNARPGVGWYVWLPDKGREIAAWTPVRVGPFVWTVGLSTPLPEILRSTGAARHIRSSFAVTGVATALCAALLLTWVAAERARLRSEDLASAQKDLSSALTAMTDIEHPLGLCLSAALRLTGAELGAIYRLDARTGELVAERTLGIADSLVPAISRLPAGNPRTRFAVAGHARFTPDAGLLEGSEAWPEGLRLRSLGMVPLVHGKQVVGCIVVASRKSVRFTPFSRKAVEAVAALAGGMVARLKAEDSLRESERRFRSVVDTAREAIVAADPSGRIVLWSAGAHGVFGYDAGRAVGMPVESLFVAEKPEDGRSGLEGAIVRREGIRSGGSRFPVELSSAAWEGGDGTYRTYVIRDVSDHERAEAEKRLLEEKLERAQRMEALGVLAGGVAHDLNNLLTPVIGYADLLIEDTEPTSPLREPLVLLREAGERAGAVVQDLLTLGRRGSYQMRVLDLNECVRDFLLAPALTATLSRSAGVVLEQNLEAGQLPISGSSPDLTKALRNLVLNACEAMPQGGVLTVRTRRLTLGARHAGYETIEPGSYAVVDVADTGEGLNEQDLERVFEPFYTRKIMGRSGTGLGLAVVYGVVHDHGGKIDVRAAKGEGTSVSLWFPLEEAVASEVGEPGEPTGGTESVLLVEDQAEQRALASRVLERFGYAVTAVENGTAAIAHVREHHVDIVILDMILEDSLDGLDCYREILRIRPGQKAIIVSGYAETERVKETLRLGAGRFLRKPYRAEALARAIRDELDRRDEPGARTK